jgi:hypothetical protein
MKLGSCCISATDSLKSIYCTYLHSVIKYGKMFLGTSFNTEYIFQRTVSTWLVKNLEVNVEIYFRNYNFTCSMPIYIFINELQYK